MVESSPKISCDNIMVSDVVKKEDEYQHLDTKGGSLSAMSMLDNPRSTQPTLVQVEALPCKHCANKRSPSINISHITESISMTDAERDDLHTAILTHALTHQSTEEELELKLAKSFLKENGHHHFSRGGLSLKYPSHRGDLHDMIIQIIRTQMESGLYKLVEHEQYGASSRKRNFIPEPAVLRAQRISSTPVSVSERPSKKKRRIVIDGIETVYAESSSVIVIPDSIADITLQSTMSPSKTHTLVPGPTISRIQITPQPTQLGDNSPFQCSLWNRSFQLPRPSLPELCTGIFDILKDMGAEAQARKKSIRPNDTVGVRLEIAKDSERHVLETGILSLLETCGIEVGRD